MRNSESGRMVKKDVLGGKDVKDAIGELGTVYGDSVVLCMNKDKSDSVFGSHKDIKKKLASVGIKNVEVRDVLKPDKSKVTCIAAVVSEVVGKK